MKRITDARALDGFRVEIRFDDGVHGVVDLAELAGRGVFSAWSEPGEFARVAIGSGGEITWPCGVDLCPDALYLQVTGKAPADLFPSLGGPEVRCA